VSPRNRAGLCREAAGNKQVWQRPPVVGGRGAWVTVALSRRRRSVTRPHVTHRALVWRGEVFIALNACRSMRRMAPFTNQMNSNMRRNAVTTSSLPRRYRNALRKAQAVARPRLLAGPVRYRTLCARSQTRRPNRRRRVTVRVVHKAGVVFPVPAAIQPRAAPLFNEDERPCGAVHLYAGSGRWRRFSGSQCFALMTPVHLLHAYNAAYAMPRRP